MMLTSELIHDLHNLMRDYGDVEVRLDARRTEGESPLPVHNVGSFYDADSDRAYNVIVSLESFDALLSAEPKCCPECETPNQSGTLCSQCRRSIGRKVL